MNDVPLVRLGDREIKEGDESIGFIFWTTVGAVVGGVVVATLVAWSLSWFTG